MDNGHGGIMRAAGPGAVRRTPEDVFRDFRARQQGLLKAFTTEVDRFYLMCDPGELPLPSLDPIPSLCFRNCWFRCRLVVGMGLPDQFPENDAANFAG